MKFFVRVFLLILSPLPFVETVHGLKCEIFIPFKELYADCMKEVLHHKGKDEQLVSKAFSCIRDGLNKRKGVPCGVGGTKCFTTIFELKDQTEIILKNCEDREDPDHVTCEHVRSEFEQGFAFTDFIQTSHCDYCASDNCNEKIPKDKPLLPSSTEKPAPPPTEKPSLPPTESRDKLSVSAPPPREQKHSVSLSAVFAPPVTALFIVISIIQILL